MHGANTALWIVLAKSIKDYRGRYNQRVFLYPVNGAQRRLWLRLGLLPSSTLCVLFLILKSFNCTNKLAFGILFVYYGDID